MPHGQAVDLLGERPYWTVDRVAEEPSYPHSKHHLPPGDRGVGQRPFVAAMYPSRCSAAIRARRRQFEWPSHHLQLITPTVDPLDVHTHQMRQQLIDPREITWSATLAQ